MSALSRLYKKPAHQCSISLPPEVSRYLYYSTTLAYRGRHVYSCLLIINDYSCRFGWRDDHGSPIGEGHGKYIKVYFVPKNISIVFLFNIFIEFQMATSSLLDIFLFFVFSSKEQIVLKYGANRRFGVEIVIRKRKKTIGKMRY